MNAQVEQKTVNKRKHASDDATGPVSITELEMLSDEEEEGTGDLSDDGVVDEFPEIDAESDDDESDEYAEEDEVDSEIGQGSETGVFIFPEEKTIISEITGQQKRVYPEIAPDYDSDSSTEDVRTLSELSEWYIHPLCRLPTASVIFQCIGMTICPTLGMTSTAKRFYALREATN